MTSTIASCVAAWQLTHGRHHLPWQTNNPYHVWVSEIMLQQTQVITVITYFKRFIAMFPTVQALANADRQAVLQHWAGLGYYQRAHRLHDAANLMMTQHDGHVPNTLLALCQLPGIGRSTAGAILALGFNLSYPILDGHVKRIFSRLHQFPFFINEAKQQSALWTLAENACVTDQPRAYIQGLMDLGANICLKKKPLCAQCPLQEMCQTHQHRTYDDYPKVFKKKPVPHVKVSWYLITFDQHIFCYQRTQRLWYGLWCFPDVYDGNTTHATYGPCIRHVFTHQIWHIQPIYIILNTLITLNETGEWLTWHVFQDKPMSKPVRDSWVMFQIHAHRPLKCDD
jgi:A/G-specific adenine glycosylase